VEVGFKGANGQPVTLDPASPKGGPP
jgi:ABC-type multidrug transport system fused ATPase/permease subunit